MYEITTFLREIIHAVNWASFFGGAVAAFVTILIIAVTTYKGAPR